jgi:hypothetical protein
LLKFQAKEEITNRILLEASLNRGFPSDSENARLQSPVLSQRTPIHAGSLGRVQGQVEFFRKIRRAPLATAATRTPYVIYLDNRSRISKVDRKMKTSKKHLIARNRIQLDNSTSTMIHKQDHHRDPTLILLLAPGTPTWSSLHGSHVG